MFVLDNAKANVSLTGQIVKKKGEDYLHYNKMIIKIKVVAGKLHLDNLFGGEPVLGLPLLRWILKID